MKIIGITGGIGTGKSLVLKILKRLHYQVYNTDYRAKYLMNNNNDLKKIIKYYFGDKVYLNEKLNIKFLSEIVFTDKKKIRILNNLIHPKVEEDFNLFKFFHKSESCIFIESAILYESGFYKKCNLILAVIADHEIKINRVVKRNHISREEVLKRINSQWKDSIKIILSDFIIYNNKSIKDLNKNVEKTLNLIKNNI